MNILVFSPTPIYPRDAGNRARCGWLVDKLRKDGHKIIFVYFGQEGLTPLKVKKTEEMVDSFFYIEYDYSKRRKLVGSEIWNLDDWYQNDIDKITHQISKSQRIDIVLCNYVWQTKIFSSFHHAVKIIDTHDVMGDRHLMLDAAGIARNFFYCSPEEESRGLNRGDLVIAIQEKECKYFRKICNRRVETVGMLPEPSGEIQAKEIASPVIFGYLGSDNLINRKVISDFIEKLTANNRKINFEVIIGGSVSAAISPNEKIKILGQIDRVSDFYSQIDVVINPMISGTGLKIKTVESLSYSKPIIGTDIAFEGLNPTYKFHKLNSIEDIIGACIIISEDKNELSKLIQESSQIHIRYKNKIESQYRNIFSIENKSKLLSCRREVFFVTHANFWTNEFGSHIRIFWLLQILSNICKVNIIYLGDEPYSKIVDDIKLKTLNVNIIEYDNHSDNLSSYIEKLPQSIAKNNSYNIKNRDINRFIKATQKISPEVCIFEYLDFAYLSHFLPGYTATIVDTHDVKYLRKVSFIEADLRNLLDTRLKNLTMSEELEALEKIDCVISITEEENIYLGSMLNNVLSVCLPTPIDRKYSINKDLEDIKLITQGSPIEIGFIGSKSEHNLASLNWFLDKIFSSLDSKKYSLNIFGNICEKIDLLKFKSSNIKLSGYVNNPVDVYKSINLLINPCFAGSGQKIKTIEAISYDIPVIGSSEAFSGFEQRNLQTFESTQEFLNVFIKIENDRDFLKLLLAEQKKALELINVKSANALSTLSLIFSSISPSFKWDA
jgi:hypothetical protein